jgi:hypothetical protein
MLSVRHGAKAVEFYKAAFGASELFRIEDERGAVVARLSVGGIGILVCGRVPERRISGCTDIHSSCDFSFFKRKISARNELYSARRNSLGSGHHDSIMRDGKYIKDCIEPHS